MMLSGRHIVLVEDDEIMGASIHQRLELEGATVTWVKQMGRGVSAIRTPHKPVDGVVCDIRLPDGTGEALYDALCRTTVPPPFLFITGQGGINQAVRLLRAGAADYITKPFEMGTFLNRLSLILLPAEDQADSDELSTPVGKSAMACRVHAQINDFAMGDQPVQIVGDKGLGKAKLARRIHTVSDRRAARFVEVNTYHDNHTDTDLTCALGQVGDGTLFINGLSGLSPEAQQRLFEAMTTGPAFRVIASDWSVADPLAPTGHLRTDLLYLFKEHEIFVPPLAERPEDAVWLARQLLKRLDHRREPPLKGLSSHAENALRAHEWPGNGRELRARISRAMRSATGEWLFPADIFPELAARSDHFPTLSEARDAAERQQIISALTRTQGHIRQAAKLLNVSRTTLWEKMQKLDL